MSKQQDMLTIMRACDSLQYAIIHLGAVAAALSEVPNEENAEETITKMEDDLTVLAERLGERGQTLLDDMDEKRCSTCPGPGGGCCK